MTDRMNFELDEYDLHDLVEALDELIDTKRKLAFAAERAGESRTHAQLVKAIGQLKALRDRLTEP